MPLSRPSCPPFPMLLLHLGSMERKIRVKVAEGAILQINIHFMASAGKATGCAYRTHALALPFSFAQIYIQFCWQCKRNSACSGQAVQKPEHHDLCSPYCPYAALDQHQHLGFCSSDCDLG